ncbi:MAG: DUF4382 domain-containing protein [Bacteroidota bacterium]|nr:DUF4382 domain-containing protein [Bacteroidota bacterium]
MKLFLAAVGALLCATIIGCSNSSNPTGLQSGQGEMKMFLTDSPAAFDSVIIEVERVEVHSAEGENDSLDNEDSLEHEENDSLDYDDSLEHDDSHSDWMAINDKPAQYDLLSLRNGVQAALGDTMLPAGHYSQIRLMIGAGSYVVENGVRHDLTIPSGFQTGIKLVNGFDVQANQALALTLDFDAASSIIITGNGRYMLKPTIRVMEE